MNLEYPLNQNYHAYKHIEIIKTKQHKVIIFGWNSAEDDYGVLCIQKLKSSDPVKPLAQMVKQYGPFRTYEQAKTQLQKEIGHYHSKQTFCGFGIIGFHKFLQGYYLMYISEIQSIAKVGRHKIHQIKKTALISLFQIKSQNKSNEVKYRQLLEEFNLQNFYFSNTYDLTNTMAKNMIRNALPFFLQGQKKPANEQQSIYSGIPNIYGICEIFQYNYGIQKEFSQIISNKKWLMAITHGYCKHINTKWKGTIFNIIIIARRSRHHAGTRYIKRGISENGFAANFVEVQQIVVNFHSSQDTRPVCSSYVQVRGSVPTYWMQRPSIAIPKPAIQVKKDDITFLGTRKHFRDMVARYGKSLYCINLMKKKQKTIRQSGLSGEYSMGINFINKQDLKEENHIHYVEFDMKYHLKQDKKAFINKVKTFAYHTFIKTGMFICMNNSRSSHQQFLEFQNGVIRANCVDCLDRTNSFQQLVGETALVVQLNRLLKEDVKFQDLELDQYTYDMYSKLYEEMGDLISIQYGSSLAHKQKIQKSTESRFQLLTSITRHLNNNWKDYDRQEQIDVFLGYQPDPNGPQIWDTKPPIEHFPAKSLSAFQKTKSNQPDWFNIAYSYFKQSHYFQVFEQISDKEKIKLLQVKIQQLSKDHLKNKFNPQILSGLINQKQVTALLRFCVLPKLILQKRAWKAMNPKSKNIQSLQQKLSYCYNKMDFLKNEDAYEQSGQAHMSPIKMDQYEQISPQSPLKAQKKPKLIKLMKATSVFQQQFQFKEDLERYVNCNAKLDEQQIQLIENYLKGQVIKDQEIERQIQSYYKSYTTDASADYLDLEFYEAQAQIMEIQAKLEAKNYVYFDKRQEQDQKQTLNAQSRTINKIQIFKKELNKDNKVLALEQLLKKNFSQGFSKRKIIQI